MGGPNLFLLILLILTYPNLSHLSQWSKFPDGTQAHRRSIMSRCRAPAPPFESEPLPRTGSTVRELAATEHRLCRSRAGRRAQGFASGRPKGSHGRAGCPEERKG